MTCNDPSDVAMRAMLQEHALLRAEINDRLRTAFSHVAYAGALLAFAMPMIEKFPSQGFSWLACVSAVGVVVGLAVLLWVACLNMRWVQHSGVYVRGLEHRINEQLGCTALAWEHYAEEVRAFSWFCIPKPPGGRGLLEALEAESNKP